MVERPDDHSPIAHADDPTIALTGPVDVRSVALTIIAVVATIWVLRETEEVCVPIVLSILISYALEPAVGSLARLHVPRVIGSALVVLLTLGGLGALGWGLSDDAAQVVQQLPAAAQKLRISLRDGRASSDSAVTQMQRAASELQKTADEATPGGPAPSGVARVQIVEPALDVRGYLMWGSAGLVSLAGQVVLIGFFAFFLLASGDLYKRKFVRMAGPSLASRRITVQILDEINTQIARFLLVRIATSTVVGVTTWLVFRWVGLQHAAVWGLLAGVFNSIPYFGPVIVMAGTAVVGFVQFGTLAMAIYVSSLSLVITSLEGWLLTPWLTSRASQTNEIAVFVGLLFWGWVWGLWGTLLAVPMLVAFKAVCDRVEGLKGVGELLGA